MRQVVFLLLTTLLTGHASTAWGQGAPAGAEDRRASDEAEARFNTAMQLIEQERWSDALAELDQSIALYPSQAASFNRALCLRLLGRHVDAVRALEDLLEQFGGAVGARRRAEIDAQISELGPLVARIDVRVEGAAAAAVIVDAEEVGQTPLRRSIVVVPGRHVIEIQADGRLSQRRSVTLAPGEELRLDIELEPTARAPAAGAVPLVATQPTTPSRGLVVGGAISAGVAVALLGTVLGLSLWNGERHQGWERDHQAILDSAGADDLASVDAAALFQLTSETNDLHESIRSVDAACWALLAVGVATSITATVLLVLGLRRRSVSAPQVTAAPQPGGFVLGLSGAFGRLR